MADLIPAGVSLDQIPLAPNPDGSPPNFVDPPSLAGAVMAVGLVFAIWATTFMVMRLYNNITTARGLGLDDALATFALIIAHCYLGLAISFGDGQRHSWDVPLSMFTPAYSMKTTITGIIQGPGIGMAKAAILITQLRIFSVKPSFRWTSYGGIAFITLVHWSNVPVYAALCTPRSGEDWGLAVMLRCAKTALHQVVVGPLSTAFDIFLFVLPLTIIVRLHVNRKTKIGLFLTFGTGFVAIIASAVSLYYRVALWNGEDLMWNGGMNYIFALIEYYIAIIVGCAPAMLSFWRQTLRDSSVMASLRSLLPTSKSQEESSYQEKVQHSDASLPGQSGNDSHPSVHKTSVNCHVSEASSVITSNC